MPLLTARRALPLSLLVCAAPVWADAALTPGSYRLTPANAEAGFAVGNLLVMTVEGKFTDFAATLQIAPTFTASHLDATIKTASIATDNTERDAHLRTAEFFDVQKFPDMRFVSSAFTGTPDNFTIKGQLTIKQTTKELILSGHAAAPAGHFVATGVIDRQVFGLENGPTIKDDVKISLAAQLPR